MGKVIATSAKAISPTPADRRRTRSPTSRCLQDKARILAVMKDGEFHRAPATRNARTTRWLPEENRDERCRIHQRSHPRRHRPEPLHRSVLVQAPHPPGRPPAPRRIHRAAPP